MFDAKGDPELARKKGEDDSPAESTLPLSHDAIQDLLREYVDERAEPEELPSPEPLDQAMIASLLGESPPPGPGADADAAEAAGVGAEPAAVAAAASPEESPAPPPETESAEDLLAGLFKGQPKPRPRPKERTDSAEPEEPAEPGEAPRVGRLAAGAKPKIDFASIRRARAANVGDANVKVGRLFGGTAEEIAASSSGRLEPPRAVFDAPPPPVQAGPSLWADGRARALALADRIEAVDPVLYKAIGVFGVFLFVNAILVLWLALLGWI